jgi:hypothetical protein
VVVVLKALGTNRVPGSSTLGFKRDVRNPRGFGESLPKIGIEIEKTGCIVTLVVSNADPRDSRDVTFTDPHHLFFLWRRLRATLLWRSATLMSRTAEAIVIGPLYHHCYWSIVSLIDVESVMIINT